MLLVKKDSKSLQCLSKGIDDGFYPKSPMVRVEKVTHKLCVLFSVLPCLDLHVQ